MDMVEERETEVDWTRDDRGLMEMKFLGELNRNRRKTGLDSKNYCLSLIGTG